ncbi:MAG TPA: DinB family protein [Mucilaginibacter sp.]|jgi:hypothetical protein|nr:DinB family protein [Mucilaginibacter sp.]
MTDTINNLAQAIESVANNNQKRIDWDFKPGPGKWSKKEIIGHLIDSAQINLQRFVRCTYEENFKLVYEQVAWVKAQRYQEAGIDELLELWQLLNRQIVRVLENYPPGRLTSQCDNNKTGVSLHTVEWLAQDYLDHMNHHLGQIY